MKTAGQPKRPVPRRRPASGIETKILVALVVAIALGIWGWPKLLDIRGGFGDPTALLPDETPLAAVCRLRQQFLSLPEPMYEGFDWHERWSDTKFGTDYFEFGPYWEIKPTEATRAFARAHSRLEIVVVVGPYTNDPTLAQKAAAVLAALPVRSRAGLYDVQTYSRLLANEKAWDLYDWRNVHSALETLYGLDNTTSRLTGNESEDAGTLEAWIVATLEDQAGMTGILFPEVDKGARPEPAADFVAFLDRWPRDWAATVLFPFATSDVPRGSSGLEQAMWAFDLAEKYWPLLVDTPFADPGITRDTFREEVGVRARAICVDGKPRDT